MRGGAGRFYNAWLNSSINGIGGVDIAGNVCVTIAGSYNSSGNLDRFVNVGGLYSVSRFCSIGVFGCNSGRGG